MRSPLLDSSHKVTLSVFTNDVTLLACAGCAQADAQLPLPGHTGKTGLGGCSAAAQPGSAATPPVWNRRQTSGSAVWGKVCERVKSSRASTMAVTFATSLLSQAAVAKTHSILPIFCRAGVVIFCRCERGLIGAIARTVTLTGCLFSFGKISTTLVSSRSTSPTTRILSGTGFLHRFSGGLAGRLSRARKVATSCKMLLVPLARIQVLA